jgi:hypothetical protein
MIGCAGAGRPRRLDGFPGNKKAPGASAEQFVGKAAALVWTINIWVVTARAWWMRCRATPARRAAAAGAHSGSAVSTAGGSSFPGPQRGAVAANPEVEASVTCISWLRPGGDPTRLVRAERRPSSVRLSPCPHRGNRSEVLDKEAEGDLARTRGRDQPRVGRARCKQCGGTGRIIELPEPCVRS